MTTKAEERKALEQIKKIMESLGEHSYIATAMDGMIKDAEDNIENDWAMSWKDRAQTAEQACDLRREEAYKLGEEVKALKAQNENQTKMLELRDEWLKQKSDRIDELNHQIENAGKDICEKISEISEMQKRIEALEMETIKLKAKLYDMIA